MIPQLFHVSLSRVMWCLTLSFNSHRCNNLLLLYRNCILPSQRLYEVFPAKDVKYGHIYNRSMIGNLLVVLTRAQQREQGHDLPSTELPLPDLPFSAWDEDDWDMLSQYLQAIADNLKRLDADATFREMENSEINGELAQSDAFGNRLEKTKRVIMFNKIVAPIRRRLEVLFADNNFGNNDYPKIDESMVESLW